ncbi:putative ATP-dependent endonuclease of the OLD family [Desulfocicer vacuolatum DSM 3385]|uniref:Putative ATP-dependent endonuclease of the OLD family n=1 Tax=Desulfocicer vacuolatum DSM 3385 TaxID=1121400 RepID=A0A1W2CYH1_9BACT|nr:AAA family ATPase [Desulfocicer vacuolatum]SMC89892.1 putative ATP-dependent endonuclease of the OLD family [Desulfocicer vacuolatum DSM 3385]
MYLKNLQLSNFRKYKSLLVEFKNGLNVLIGENDSGKTGIIDAIRYLLNTKSFEPVRFDPKDFYQNNSSLVRAESFEIAGVFDGFNDSEAANFLEWGYFNQDKNFELRLLLKVNLQNNNRITWDLKAGPENAETQMDGNARELLQVTYLKPLRDAETELTPGYRSRLAQILQSHRSFQKTKDKKGQTTQHPLETIIKEANKNISNFLGDVKANDQKESENIITQINQYIEGFKHKDDPRLAELKIANPELNKILRSLGLSIEENSSGLGTLNKLFMAAELLHLETDPYNSIRLCLIEELEAHLHPQAQLRVINTLKNVSSKKNTQFILTTHSTTLGASIDLQNLILCNDGGVYPMGEGETQLDKGDYKFLQRFLNSTKANLFFAKGVIMVEGDAENILIPTIAELIGMPLHQYGVSIVNVSSTAFLRYANIFMRKDDKQLNIPVAVVTDLDVRAMEYYTDRTNDSKIPLYHKVQEKKIKTKDKDFDVSSIYGNYYSNEKEFKDAIKGIITKGQTKTSRMPNGVNDTVDKWVQEELSVGTIDSIRKARYKTITSKFDMPVKAFL